MIKRIINHILIFLGIKESPNPCIDCINRFCVSNYSPCYNCKNYCNYECDPEYIPREKEIIMEMRDATKEEREGIKRYIDSISDRVYTESEVIEILSKLFKKIGENKPEPTNHFRENMIVGMELAQAIIQSEIDQLKKERREGEENNNG